MKALDIFVVFILNMKVYGNKITYKITYNTTYESLYYTASTVPGGAIYHNYPLAFNIGLKKYN